GPWATARRPPPTPGAPPASNGKRRPRPPRSTSIPSRSSPSRPTNTIRPRPSRRRRKLSHNHHPDLAHHFDDLEQQRQAGNIGMWLFLATEVMIFGGLFTAYIVYRWKYPEAFAVAAGKMAWQLAAFNTVVLLTSSLTMALAVHAAATGNRQ